MTISEQILHERTVCVYSIFQAAWSSNVEMRNGLQPPAAHPRATKARRTAGCLRVFATFELHF